ncbi:MAG: amidohydrolase family protein [Spirochaetota bacterium]
MKTVLKNGTILTMETAQAELIHGDIGIEGETIVFIGEQPADFRADLELDAQGGIVMPGLVDAHTHIAMSLMRHYADDLPFWSWLFERILPVEENLIDEHVYHGSRLSLVELIRSGVTTFADMYSNMDAVAQATLESGLRANLTRGLMFNGPEDLVKLEEGRRFYKDWNGKGGGRLQVDVGPHAVYTIPPEYMLKVAELAKELNTRIHIHLSESRKEVDDCLQAHGKTPIAHARDQGLFECKTYGAHCVHITDEDIRILQESGVSVINNPTSNLKLGNGFAPVTKLLEAGVNVALGTDGSASNNNLNMFEETHLAALVNKGVTEDPTTVSAYTALQMATINGARALGLEETTGSLKVGKKADIIVIDIEAPHFYPRHSVSAGLVYAAQSSDVKTVICNGEVVMQDRQLTQLDEQEIYRKAQASAAAITGNKEFMP